MHKCPHCGEKTITTLKKLMPGWRPRCRECGGKWRLSYFPILFIMAMPSMVVPIMIFLALNGMGIRTPVVVTLALCLVSLFMVYISPLVKKK